MTSKKTKGWAVPTECASCGKTFGRDRQGKTVCLNCYEEHFHTRPSKTTIKKREDSKHICELLKSAPQLGVKL